MLLHKSLANANYGTYLRRGGHFGQKCNENQIVLNDLKVVNN